MTVGGGGYVGVLAAREVSVQEPVGSRDVHDCCGYGYQHAEETENNN